MKILEKKIILASKSPRRRQLMQEAGFNFVARSTDADESYLSTMPVDEVAPYLAKKKAFAARDWIEQDEIVLAADSVVILKDKIYEKPKDYLDAVNILKELSGQTHRVVTGVCLCTKEREKVFSSTTKVYFADLSDMEIDYYIKTYKPYDKAGSYGVQEWLGHCKVIKIEGSFTNVMGLPMYQVYDELGKFLTLSV